MQGNATIVSVLLTTVDVVKLFVIVAQYSNLSLLLNKCYLTQCKHAEGRIDIAISTPLKQYGHKLINLGTHQLRRYVESIQASEMRTTLSTKTYSDTHCHRHLQQSSSTKLTTRHIHRE